MNEERSSDARAIVACSMSWGSLPDDVLAAAVVGTFDASPRIREENKALRPARDLRLIEEDGTMHELTFKRLMHAARRLTGLPG